MNLLFIGDIVGSAGRKCVSDNLQQLKEQYSIDFVIANGENAAHGKGMTIKIYNQLLDCGIDMITMGNHTFSKDSILSFIDDADQMIRPMNMEPTEYGEHTRVVKIKKKKVAITNLSGEVWMHQVCMSPFDAMEEILEDVDADIYLVDLHAEATSEKIAFVYNFVNRVQVVVGTHTHVQTADERIIDGTAAITDLGMCGVYHSVLGRDCEEIIKRFTSDEPTKFTMAEGAAIFCGCVVTIDENSLKATGILRVQIRPE